MKRKNFRTLIIVGCVLMAVAFGSICAVSAPDDGDRLPSSIIVPMTPPDGDRLPSNVIIPRGGPTYLGVSIAI